MADEETLNPIVAAAMRIRARRSVSEALNAPDADAHARFEDAASAFAAFVEDTQRAVRLLNSILGKSGVKFIRLERPLRLRLRFAEKRISADLDEPHQLVRIDGCGLDGEYQFDPDAPVPSLINLSKISTEAGYGERLTGRTLVKLIAQDAELPPPSHDSSAR